MAIVGVLGSMALATASASLAATHHRASGAYSAPVVSTDTTNSPYSQIPEGDEGN